jgi:phosphatidylserine/phosphatidylglycerophosphate/cardiolipin synthase-like enzyme
VEVERWLLTARERGNDDTSLDTRHGGSAWSTGNDVVPLVHGAAYFAELLRRVERMRSGDLLLFTDWRGDPDERLGGPDTGVADVFGRAVARGVVVKGLIWRSHLDRLKFSARENRQLGEDVNRAGGECIRDMRTRPGGSHHQKLVVLRHPGRPELDVAFVGGIDLCHSRRDDAEHAGDPQPQSMSAAYGRRPPWHDVQLQVRGPAVGDLETCFRERWDDPRPVTRNPLYRVSDLLHHDDDKAERMPEQLPDPEPVGRHAVQVLRTYPPHGYPFAREGERSIARAYRKAIANACRLIYLEDQYLWSAEVIRPFADALRENPDLRFIAVVPHHPDQDGRLSLAPSLVGRHEALTLLHGAAADRVAVYGVENRAGTPVYVHAKVCVVDDVWASVGSDNVNRRSWTHDSELACAVLDEEADGRAPFADTARRFAHELRLELAREHLDRAAGEDGDLLDPVTAFEAFRASAQALAQWHAGGRQGPRPPGRLRPYRLDPVQRPTRLWARPVNRLLVDPDGRPWRLRRSDVF